MTDLRQHGRLVIGSRAGVAMAMTLFLILLVRPVRAQPTQGEAGKKPTPTFELVPQGYVQLDWRGYPGWTVTPGTGQLEFETFEVRRLRAGVEGRWRRVAFEVGIDPNDEDGTLVRDAYAQVRFSRAVRIRGGQFKLPGSLDYQTSSRTLDFMERSALATSLAAGRDVGLMISGQWRRALEYDAGVFAGDGNGRRSRANTTVAARVGTTVLNGIDLGGSIGVGGISATDTEPANGLEGRSSSGYRFFERVYVQGRRARLGADARWERGRWQVSAGVLRTHDQRRDQGQDFEDLPALAGTGWTVAIVRQFGRRAGARFGLRQWDLGARFDALRLDDVGPDTESDSVRPRATNVRARAVQTLTSTASWRPTPWSRVIGNVALDRYPEERSAPEAGRTGPYWTGGMRLQLQLPW